MRKASNFIPWFSEGQTSLEDLRPASCVRDKASNYAGSCMSHCDRYFKGYFEIYAASKK